MITKSGKLNVLVVSGGSFQGLSVIKGLRYSDSVRIIVADSSVENIGKYFSDKFYVVPEVERKELFLHSLLDICRKEDIRIVIPSTNIELLTLAESSYLFTERDIYVAVSNLNFLHLVMNKHTLYQFLMEEGFPTLPVLDIESKSLRFPILGKPLYGWGSKGTLKLNSRSEMNEYNLSDLKKHYVWQPYLKDFKEFSIDCAITFDGAPSDFVIRQRLKTIGGFAVITESDHDSKMRKTAQDFFALISSQGARGIFNIQILKNNSDYFFSDVNPRIGTSAVFSYELGINFPLLLCSCINPDLSPVQYPTHSKSKELKMIRYLDELYIEKKDTEKIRAIVFDLDDTLINQKIWIYEKLEILWSEFESVLPGKREFALRGILLIEEGKRSQLFDALSEEYGFPSNLKQQLIKAYRQIIPQHCPLFPDVMMTLKELKKLDFKLALLTDNPPESQKQKVATCNFEGIFDAIVYSKELEQEKPNKAAFLEVAKLLSLPVHSLAMIGDNLYKDIAGSLDSGYRLAFWLNRRGTFFNFDEKLFNTLTDNKYDFVEIFNLRNLLFYFK